MHDNEFQAFQELRICMLSIQDIPVELVVIHVQQCKEIHVLIVFPLTRKMALTSLLCYFCFISLLLSNEVTFCLKIMVVLVYFGDIKHSLDYC